jgi:FkbM family methyltransferase
MFFYNFKQSIRDFILKIGNPFKLANFSPQHKKLIDLGPYDQVLHIGANTGQEFSLYNFLRVKSVIWIEPDKQAFRKLRSKGLFYGNIKKFYINEFISDTTGAKVDYYQFNKSGANSTFKPTESFLESNGGRRVKNITTVVSITIEDALIKYNIDIKGENNLLVIDVQGNEMSVLNGFRFTTLKKFRVIMCEFSQEIYENSVLPADLKQKLEELGYTESLAPIRRSDDAIFIRFDAINQ